MKKVLIFYATYGGGHLSAAKSIKQYLEDHYSDSIQVEMLDCVEYVNKLLNRVTTGAYREMAKKAPWAWEKVYYQSQSGVLAKISNTSNKIMAAKMAKFFKEFSPDIVISTHPFGSQMTSYLKKKGRTSCKLTTVMTDFAIHDQWLVGYEYVDSYFVANDKMKSDMVDKGIDANKIFVTGIPVSGRFLLPLDCTSTLKDLNLVSDKKTVLFFGGGEFGLGKDRTVALLKILSSLPFDFQVIAIAGKNEKMKAAFEEVVKEAHIEDRFKVLPFTNKVPELMAISDFVITKPGGLTTTESLVSGLPIVVINPLPGQEEENAQFLEDYGAGIWLKEEKDAKQVFTSLLKDDILLDKMKHQVSQIARKNSTATICDTIMKGNENGVNK